MQGKTGGGINGKIVGKGWSDIPEEAWQGLYSGASSSSKEAFYGPWRIGPGMPASPGHCNYNTGKKRKAFTWESTPVSSSLFAGQLRQRLRTQMTGRPVADSWARARLGQALTQWEEALSLLHRICCLIKITKPLSLFHNIMSAPQSWQTTQTHLSFFDTLIKKVQGHRSSLHNLTDYEA